MNNQPPHSQPIPQGGHPPQQGYPPQGQPPQAGGNKPSTGTILAVGAVGVAAVGVAAVGATVLGVGGYMAYQSHEASAQDKSPIKLKIKVISASNLQAADSGNTSDPYVTVKQGHISVKTKVIPKQLNPVWNEEFQFGVHQTDVQVGELEISVYDKDKLSDDSLGSVRIPLNQIPLNAALKEFDLALQGGNKKKPQNGHVKVSVAMDNTQLQPARDLPGAQYQAAPQADYYSQQPQGGYPPQGYAPQGYPQGYPPQADYYSQQPGGYQSGYPPQGYPPQGGYQSGYPPQGYPPQGYPPQADYSSQQPGGYQSGYPPQGYPPQGYPQGYPPQ